jgi:hypothetical protein
VLSSHLLLLLLCCFFSDVILCFFGSARALLLLIHGGGNAAGRPKSVQKLGRGRLLFSCLFLLVYRSVRNAPLLLVARGHSCHRFLGVRYLFESVEEVCIPFLIQFILTLPDQSLMHLLLSWYSCFFSENGAGARASRSCPKASESLEEARNLSFIVDFYCLIKERCGSSKAL